MPTTLADALAPMTLAEMREVYFGKKSFVITRNDSRFEHLLSLERLEERLNDGSGALVNMAVIQPDGSKFPRKEIYYDTDGDWAPTLLRKQHVRELLEGGHSVVLHNMAQATREISELLGSIEEAFPGMHADLHVYLSPRAGATKFRVHRDTPQHKIYLQLIGSTDWTVYLGSPGPVSMSDKDVAARLTPHFETRLTPGSLLYMPPSVYHRVTSVEGPRVSLSIPFAHHPDEPKIDRSHIPLREIMATSMTSVTRAS